MGIRSVHRRLFPSALTPHGFEHSWSVACMCALRTGSIAYERR